MSKSAKHKTGGTSRSVNCSASRRQFAVATLAAGCTPVAVVNAVQKQPQVSTIVQPASPGGAAFIERAFQMRRRAQELGDQPYGAIVVRSGKIVGQSWSRVVIDADPTGHAEIAAIRDAASRGALLSGSVLYSSSRPCPMCEAAAAWCGIAEMIWGRDQTNAGAPRYC